MESNLIVSQTCARLDGFVAEYDKLPTPELLTELSRCLGSIVENLLRAAALVKVAEDRGHNLDDLRERFGDLLNQLRLVGHGNLEAGVIQRFYGKDALISRIATLPKPDQQRLACGDPVRLLVPKTDGSGLYTHRMIDPAKLSKKQVARVFGRGHIRSDAEQAAMLDEERHKAALPVPQKIGLFRIDADTGDIRFDGKHGDRVSRENLEAVLRAVRKKETASS